MTDNRKRAVAAERDSIVGMFRVLDILAQTNEQNERTVKRAEYGLRDYRLIMSKLEKLLRRVFMTIPADQMHQIKRQMEMSYLKLAMYTSPGKKEDGLWVVDNDDLVELISMASQGACMLCDGKRKDCPLSRLMDELPVQVNDTFLVACKGGI